MRKILFFIITILPYLYASEFLSYELPFKEGKIELKIDGNQKGSSTIYFKNYGKEIAIYEEFTSKIMFQEDTIRQLTIIKNEQQIKIDLNTNLAIIDSTLHYNLVNIFNNLSDDDKEYILSIPSKEFLNFECQDITVDGKSECYNGFFSIFSNTDIFGYKVSKYPISFIPKKIDIKYFTPPSDLKIIKENKNLEKATQIIKSMLE